MSSATPYRIDPADLTLGSTVATSQGISPSRVRGRGLVDESPSAMDKKTPRRANRQILEADAEGSSQDLPDREGWLRLHAIDLIGRLQAWEEELNRRQIDLIARSAAQAQRERKERMGRHFPQPEGPKAAERAQIDAWRSAFSRSRGNVPIGESVGA